MKKIIFVSFFYLCCWTAFGQLEQLQNQTTDPSLEGAINTNGKATKNIKTNTKIADYKIISIARDTTVVDTSLTLKKLYRYNFLRKDYFELLPFANTGQPYNQLAYDLSENDLLPQFGARAKHFNYYEVEDVYYYDVPTPFTELLFKTTMEQGQLLNALFTINTNRRFNFSLAYKAHRSLGKYQNVRATSGSFRSSATYNTKNEKYFLRAHVAMQGMANEENGGITAIGIEEFESGNEEFLDRSRFEVNLQDAENKFAGKRFFIDHYFTLSSKKDSLNQSALSLGHVFNLEDKKYIFKQDAANDYFGDAFQSASLRDEVRLERLENQLYARYNSVLGDIRVQLAHTDYNYGYNAIVVLNSGELIPNRLKNNATAVGASYKKLIKDKILLRATAGLNVAGDFDGNYIDAQADYDLKEDMALSAALNINSKAPNFNYQLHQSDYVNYNWQNNFENISTQTIKLALRSKKLLDASVSFSNVDNYAYFAENTSDSLVKPFQSANTINYIKVKAHKDIKVGKFGLDNTLMYQKVTQDQEVFNVPEIITRNTLYFETHLFKKAMFIQTGITFNYFTAYKMNAYDPLLSEFYVQNTSDELGGFPRIDAFLNAKVRNARIFLKAEHLNSSFTGYNYYSAPNNPYRDFIIRFGMVWDFFL